MAACRNYGVACYFFSVDRVNEHSVHHVLSSLAKQLAARATQPIKDVERLYDESQHGKATPTSDQLKTTIFSIVNANTFTRMFFIFDALDECKPELRVDFVSLFRQMADEGINVFVTSRPNIHEINPAPTDVRTIQLSAYENDLRTYLEGRIRSMPYVKQLVSEYQRSSGEDAVTVLCESANGM